MIVLNVKEIRLAREMTLEELAELTGKTKSYLSKVENGKAIPSLPTLEIISLHLKSCLKEIIYGCDHLHCKKCNFLKYHRYKFKRK